MEESGADGSPDIAEMERTSRNGQALNVSITRLYGAPVFISKTRRPGTELVARTLGHPLSKAPIAYK